MARTREARRDAGAALSSSPAEACAESFQIGDGGCHARNVLVDEGAGFNLAGRSVGDKVLAEGRESVQKLESTPHETHVRTEYLVAGADKVVAVECLHIDERVRSIVNAIENDLSAGGVRQLGNGSDIDNGTECMGGNRAGNKTGLRGEERREVLNVKVVIFTHLPPDNPGPFALKLQPCGDIGFVVEVRDDDLVAGLEGATDREAEQTKERRGVHAESDLVAIARVDQSGDALAGARDGCVDFHALGVASAALHVAVQKMTIDRVENDLGNLRASAVIEEDEAWLLG